MNNDSTVFSHLPQRQALEFVLPGERSIPLCSQVPLSEREISGYSIRNAIKAALTGNWSKAGFERSVTMATLQGLGDADMASNRLIVPAAVLARDLVAGTGSAGGFLVNTEMRGVLDALRPRLVAARLGAQVITGLRNNVTYARNAGSLTLTWQATEGTPAVETENFNTGQIALTPKTVTGLVEASRVFQLLTLDVGEAMILRELRLGVAAGVDAAAFGGTGASGQPTGLLNTAGIGTFNGASITYANLLEAQTDVLSANALTEGGRVAFTCRPAVASVLAQRQGFNASSPPCWVGPLAEGQLIGCPAITSIFPPAATLVAGDFAQMMLAEWGAGLDVRVDPYTGFLSGRVGLAASLSVDVGVAWPQAFSVATSVS